MGVALPIGVMLENAMEELFVRYTEGTKYIERESKSLGEMYVAYLAKFTKYHVSVSLPIHVWSVLTQSTGDGPNSEDRRPIGPNGQSTDRCVR